jgi:hypothetical protein
MWNLPPSQANKQLALIFAIHIIKVFMDEVILFIIAIKIGVDFLLNQIAQDQQKDFDHPIRFYGRTSYPPNVIVFVVIAESSLETEASLISRDLQYK